MSEQKKTKYIVVNNIELGALEREVTMHLNNGWKIAGPFTTGSPASGFGRRFFQPMTKEE